MWKERRDRLERKGTRGQATGQAQEERLKRNVVVSTGLRQNERRSDSLGHKGEEGKETVEKVGT